MSLRYGYLDKPENLRLVCMFDAAFCVRRDNSSQGGYIVMLVPESTFHGKESEYHVIDWKSSKLPRVARSSLGAEAQAAGLATDSIDFICKFWDHIQCPNFTLEQLLHRPSDLRPTLVTDAKALYDSYFREGSTSSITDKRIGLEVQVMKERLQDLGGTMKWISSERQFADSLTKDATKQLLADRLRYHKIKLTWDPDYQAAKKKSLADRNSSRDEFAVAKPSKDKEIRTMDESEEQEMSETPPKEVPVEAFALVALTKEAIEYVDVSKNVAVTDYNAVTVDDEFLEYEAPASHGMAMAVYFKELLTYVAVKFQGIVFALLWMVGQLPGAEAMIAPEEEGQCGLDEMSMEENYGVFEVAVVTLLLVITGLCYWAGRMNGWQRGRTHRLHERHIGYNRAVARNSELEDEVEKLKTSLTQFRELSYNYGRGLVGLRDENYSITEHVWNLEAILHEKDEALQELRDEMDVVNHTLARHVNYRIEARRILERADREMQDHYAVCPFRRPVWCARYGRVWHYHRDCQSLDHAVSREIPPCTFCAGRQTIPPRDPITGTALIQDIQQWFQNVVD